jgi:diketogulonate reductase-like aldo/keto reductase
MTTKFNPARRDPVAEVERCLEQLGVERVDPYIVHWPKVGPTWAWPGMERAQELGYARSIGFQTSRSPNSSRYGEHRAGRQPGAVQSVRVPEGRLGTCRADGIILEAYSPLGRGRHLGSETATRIAQRLGRTPAQVLLRWCIERGVPLVAKSTHRDRIAENAEIFDFTLSDEDMAELDALDRTGGTQRALERKWW